MNAGSPSAVVPNSCLPLSSPPKFSVRQALAPNVCFHSVLSPCRCVLLLSPAAGNTSFFHPPHGRRKHSKFLLVVKGSSSTFEESRAQVAESTRAKAEPTVRGRVSWSADGKPTILWAAPKQQGRGGFPNGERRLDGGQSLEKDAEPTGKPDARHGSHVPSAGEQKEFILPKHRQSAAHLADAIAVPKAPSPRHSDIFSPSSASRLLIGSNAPKHKAETDAPTSPISPAQQVRTSLTRSKYDQFQGGAPVNGIPLRKEDDHQGGPVFKSKLEEILNEFRNRQQLEERSKDKKARKNNPEDISKEGGSSSPGSTSNVSRRKTISSTPLSWKSARRDHQNNDYGGMNDANFSNENFDAAEDHGKEPNEKGIFTTRHQNRAYIQTDHDPLDLPNSSLRTSQRSRKGLSPVMERHSFIRNKNSTSLVGQASEYKPMKNNSSQSHSKSTGKIWVNDKQEHLASGDRFYERPLKDGMNHQPQSQMSGCNGEKFNEEGSNYTALHNESDSEDDSLQNKDSTAGLKTVKEEPLVNYKLMQNNSSKSHPKSKGKVWVNDKKGRLASNDKATERPNKDGMKYRPQFQMSGCNGENIDEESGNYTADSEGDSIQNKDSSAELKTVKKEPLVANGKATWHSQSDSSLPFEYQFSYSEVPNAPILRYREKPFSPFGPQTMSRPWTGGPPLTKNKRNVPLFDSFNPPPKGKRGVKYVQDPGPYRRGQGPKPARTRDEILGEPLANEEIAMLIDSCQEEKRQLNLGRDGLTHNMLDLIHCHWKRRRVIRVRCLGIPTVDMNNVCFHLEDKTGGKVIYCSGGIVYLFRGRNYNYKDRPEIPLMLWKPISPVYPRLIQRAPGGLTEEEANQLRELGKKVEPLCKLNKNGIYYKLADDVRVAFKVDKLVRIDCRGLNPSDYRKIGAKLKDLVPCVLLSFDDEQILMWKGKETSTDPASLKESTAEVTTEGSLADDTGPTPKRDLEDIETDLTGATVQIQHAELITDDFPPGGHVGSELSSRSEGTRYGHKAFGAQGEQDLYKPNLLSQDARVQIHSITAPDGMVDNARASPADTRAETSSYSELPFWTKGQENQTAPLQVIGGLPSSGSSPGNMESGGAAEDDPSDTDNAAHFNDLWDEAITSGIAVQLDAAEMDNDTVVTRARKLAAEVPAGEEYTRTLIKSLRVRAPRIAQPSQQLHKHLRKIRKMKLERKLAKRRPSKIQRTNFEDARPDGQGRAGMHVDELAQLLSMR